MAGRAFMWLVVATLLVQTKFAAAQYPPAYGGMHYGGSVAPMQPYTLADPQSIVPGVDYYGPDRIVTRQAPQDDEWLEPSPLEKVLKHVLHNSYYRVEYLLWQIDEPGNVVLSTSTTGVQGVNDYTEKFAVSRFGAISGNDGTVLRQKALAPTLDDMEFRDNNGVRGTIGIPLSFGTLEVNSFILEQASESLKDAGFRIPSSTGGTDQYVNLAIVTTGVNGLNSNLLLFDRDFTATMTSDFWGGQANLIFNSQFPPSWEGFKLMPLVGFRYQNLHESLTIFGSFDGPRRNQPFRIRRYIDSNVQNNVFGPQVGFRTEFQHRFFTLGVEPKIALSANSWKARVATEGLRFVGDPLFETYENGNRFAASAELSAYASINVTRNLSLFVSYNYMWMDEVSRPYDNISYDSNGSGATVNPGITANAKFSDLQVQGLTVGGTWIFW